MAISEQFLLIIILSGLIFYDSQVPLGQGDFISFGLSDGYAEFRFDVGSGPTIMRSHERLSMGDWHTVKISRTKKEGKVIFFNV